MIIYEDVKKFVQEELKNENEIIDYIYNLQIEKDILEEGINKDYEYTVENLEAQIEEQEEKISNLDDIVYKIKEEKQTLQYNYDTLWEDHTELTKNMDVHIQKVLELETEVAYWKNKNSIEAE